VVFLSALGVLALSLAMAPAVPFQLFLVTAITPPALSLVRAMAMLKRIEAVSPTTVCQAYTVAFVYDAARALALVARQGHRRAV
jgi:hypothetical protein